MATTVDEAVDEDYSNNNHDEGLHHWRMEEINNDNIGFILVFDQYYVDLKTENDDLVATNEEESEDNNRYKDK